MMNHGHTPAYAEASAVAKAMADKPAGRRTGSSNARPGNLKTAERRCARAEGVGSGEREARTAKQPQGPARGMSVLVSGFINHGLHRLGSLTFAVMWIGAAFAADPAISVSAKQRYPWNGQVDLQFTITGTSGTKYDTSFTAKDLVGGTNVTMVTIRKSDGTAANATKEQLLPGNYHWVWDAAADLPEDWNCARMTVTGKAISFTYSVKFNANGGTGTMSNESFTYGTAQALTANAFTRTGYTFQGWATSASGSKVYNDKQSVNNLTETSGAVVNLYAVWKEYGVQLWANGPCWATMNIGATKPEEYGYYFWWGDTIGYKRVNNKWVASDGSNLNFSFSESNAKTHNKTIATLKSWGWIDSNNELVSARDAAHVHLGGNWRMPTKKEFDSLLSNCSLTWTTKNGVAGCIVKGKGDYSSASIFLPAASSAWGTDTPSGSGCNYWSSTANTDTINAWYLYLESSRSYYTAYSARRSGCTIRPVYSP